jgi:hypothetical protein
MPNRPAPRDMLEWEIGKAIRQEPPGKPHVSRATAAAMALRVLAAIEVAGYVLAEKADG